MSIDDSDADAVSRTEVYLSWTLRSWTCGWPISSHIHYKIYISGRAVILTWRRLNAKPTNKSTNYRRSGLTPSQRRTRQPGRTLDICWPDFIFDDNRRSFRPQWEKNFLFPSPHLTDHQFKLFFYFDEMELIIAGRLPTLFVLRTKLKLWTSYHLW